ncbi:MAG: glycosyltransferase family 2 protein [Egibacteraceae bacterium]
MYTRNRSHLFERALGSIVSACHPVSTHVEITVSDGSDDDRTGRIVERLLAGWPGGYRYVWNTPPLDMVNNMNRAIELASGEWIQQLGDDDFLLPTAGQVMVDAIRKAGQDRPIMLFGVHIVDLDGVVRRQQTFRGTRHLAPREALRQLLGNSSFVREPGVLVRRSVYEREGLFDKRVGNPADIDMWVRLFSRYGVTCMPYSTCAYTIHEGALTTGMWNPETICTFDEIFDRAVASGVVPEHRVRRWQADFFHQFILAGAYRHLEKGRRAEAREVLKLFDLPAVRRRGLSPRWLPVRIAFVAATAGSRLSLRFLTHA